QRPLVRRVHSPAGGGRLARLRQDRREPLSDVHQRTDGNPDLPGNDDRLPEGGAGPILRPVDDPLENAAQSGEADGEARGENAGRIREEMAKRAGEAAEGVGEGIQETKERVGKAMGRMEKAVGRGMIPSAGPRPIEGGFFRSLFWNLAFFLDVL